MLWKIQKFWSLLYNQETHDFSGIFSFGKLDCGQNSTFSMSGYAGHICRTANFGYQQVLSLFLKQGKEGKASEYKSMFYLVNCSSEFLLKNPKQLFLQKRNTYINYLNINITFYLDIKRSLQSMMKLGRAVLVSLKFIEVKENGAK